jgi:histidyl-tRNA synthetase
MERLSILSSSYILSACTSSSLPKRYRLAILPVYNPHEKEQQSINNAVIKYCQELAHYCEQIRLVPSSSSSLSVVTKENNPPINSTLLELLTSSLSTSSFQSNRTLTTILCEPHGKLKSLLAQVSQQNIDIAIIIGSNEIQSGTIILKDLRTGKQITTMNTMENVSSFIQRWWNDEERII